MGIDVSKRLKYFSSGKIPEVWKLLDERGSLESISIDIIRAWNDASNRFFDTWDDQQRMLFSLSCHIPSEGESRAVLLFSNLKLCILLDGLSESHHPGRIELLEKLLGQIAGINEDLLFQCCLLIISSINKLTGRSQSNGILSVRDTLMTEILTRTREVYLDLTEDEKDVIRSFVRSEKPFTMILGRLSSQQQHELLEELLREGSFTQSRIPSYLRITLEGIRASQKLYSSIWFTKDTRPSPKYSNVLDQHPSAGISIHPPVKVSVYRPEDRFCDRPRRPGGLHVGKRKNAGPRQVVKVYKQETNDGYKIVTVIQEYMNSILKHGGVF